MADDTDDTAKPKKPGFFRKAAGRAAGMAFHGTGSFGESLENTIAGKKKRGERGYTRQSSSGEGFEGRRASPGIVRKTLGTAVGMAFYGTGVIGDTLSGAIKGTNKKGPGAGRRVKSEAKDTDSQELKDVATKVAADINELRSDMEEGIKYVLGEVKKNEQAINQLRRDFQKKNKDANASSKRLRRQIRDSKGRFTGKFEDIDPVATKAGVSSGGFSGAGSLLSSITNIVKGLAGKYLGIGAGSIAGGALLRSGAYGLGYAGGAALRAAGPLGVAYGLDQLLPEGEKSLNDKLKKYTPMLASKDENVGGINRWIYDHGAGKLHKWIYGDDEDQAKKVSPDQDKKQNPDLASGIDVDTKKDIDFKTTADLHMKAHEIKLDAERIIVTGQLIINGKPVDGSKTNPTARFKTKKEAELADIHDNPLMGPVRSLARQMGATGDWAQAPGVTRDMPSGYTATKTSGSSGSTAGPRGASAAAGDVPGRPSIGKGEDYGQKFPAGSERFFHASGNVNGVDKRLIDTLRSASKDLPAGYRMEMISGHDGRSTGTTNHPNGVATDVKIYDDQGKLVPHDGNSPGWKYYEQMYHSVQIRGEKMYPGSSWIWGGAWVGHASGPGDPMHYQIRSNLPGVSQSSGMYDPKTGFDKNSGINQGINFKKNAMSHDEREQYRAAVNARIDAEGNGNGSNAPTQSEPVEARDQSGVLDRAMNWIKKKENFQATAFADYGQTNIGYGTRARPGETAITEEEASRRLRDQASKSLEKIDRLNPNLTPGARVALASLSFNVGDGWMSQGLGQAVRDGDTERIKAIFKQYDKVTVGGQKQALPGLTKRRIQELNFFDNDNYAGGTTAAEDWGGKQDPRAGGQTTGSKESVKDKMSDANMDAKDAEWFARKAGAGSTTSDARKVAQSAWTPGPSGDMPAAQGLDFNSNLGHKHGLYNQKWDQIDDRRNQSTLGMVAGHVWDKARNIWAGISHSDRGSTPQQDAARKALGLDFSDDDMKRIMNRSPEDQKTLQDAIARGDFAEGEGPDVLPPEVGQYINQKELDRQNNDAKIAEQIPRPPDLDNQPTGEQMTARIKNDSESGSKDAQVADNGGVKASGSSQSRGSLRSPTNHPESEAPSPGSDGYGDQMCNPDSGGLCAI